MISSHSSVINTFIDADIEEAQEQNDMTMNRLNTDLKHNSEYKKLKMRIQRAKYAVKTRKKIVAKRYAENEHDEY